MHIGKAGVLYVESAGPSGVAQAFQVEFKKLGGVITTVEKSLQSSSDFRSQLTKIQKSGADVVYFTGFAKETASILKQAKELKLNLPMLTHQLAEDPEVRELAGDAANNLIFSTPKLDPSSGDFAVVDFYNKFRQKYNEDPQNFASNSYDALTIVAKAIETYGYSSDGILKGLQETKNYSGASGSITFDQNGDVIQPMRIMTIQTGKIVPY
jgi:branched-chain amino acid transport system substrate-binding protein